MPNLRLVTDNAIERATLAASSTAGANTPANLANDLKDYLWRGLSTLERLDATWTVPELIQAVGGPNCNWSPTALWRIRASNEAAATNVVRQSSAFDSVTWAKTGATPTPNYGTAPDGTNTSCRVVFSGANMSVAQITGMANGTLCSGSVWVKGVAGQTLVITAGNVQQIVTLGSGWQRLKAEGKTSTSDLFAITTQLGTTARDVELWGAQLEAGAKTTSYIPTTSAAATRAAGYIDSWQSYDYDSGWVLACPAPSTTLRRMPAVQAASAYAFGGGAFARHWMPAPVLARRLVVDINDAANLQGFVEMTNLVAAPYLEVKKNADYGADAASVDATSVNRSGAGSLMATQNPRSSKVTFSLSKMDPSDADAVWRALRSNGVGYPVWLSIFPEDADLNLEARHQIWGNFVETPAMAMPSFRISSAKLSVQSS